VLWGLTQTALSARSDQGNHFYLVGLGIGCAFGVGVVLFFKNSLPFDTHGLGFVLAALSSLWIVVAGYEARKSNENLQSDALDILTEMIRRNLLTASVNISDPDCSLSCNILDAYPTGSRDATMQEVLNSYMTGVLPKRKGGPGITLTIGQRFKLLPQEEAQIRATMAELKRPR
jgi:hypothetical protein